MVRLTVDYDSEAKVWFVRTSDLLGVHAEGETLGDLCGKLPAIVSDLVESNQERKADTCYCSFCGKSQHQVRKLIAGPTVFICDECVDLCCEIVGEKQDNPDNPAREIKLEELKQLRADVARLQDGLARIEQKINGMVEEGGTPPASRRPKQKCFPPGAESTFSIDEFDFTTSVCPGGCLQLEKIIFRAARKMILPIDERGLAT